MKTTRIVMLIMLLLTLGGGIPVIAGPQIDARIGVRPGGCVRPDLDVYVWPDRGVDAVYYPGDPISVQFEVTRDCYVVIYDIDTRGRLHILFPFDPWQDNFVQAGQVYEVPGNGDDFSLTVEGPAGDEYIQAVASTHPFDLPDWPIYVNSPGHYPETCVDPDLLDFRAGVDRLGYLHRVNRKIARDRWDWCATDLARFYVHPRPAYRRFGIHLGGWWDPWPDDFYGAVYIGWPIGTRIYVDGVFVGIAPCWARGFSYGHHWVRAFDGDRFVYEKQVRYRHKEWYRRDYPDYRLKGAHGQEIYRRAPMINPTPIEKQHAGRSSDNTWRKTRTRVAEPAREAGPRGDDTRPADRAPDAIKRTSDAPRVIQKEKPAGEHRQSKLERLLSGGSRIIGEVVEKPEPSKSRTRSGTGGTGGSAGHRVSGKADRPGSGKASKGDRAPRIPDSIRDKRR